MNRFKLICAVHLIVFKNEKILLLKRAHTGWMDGHYGVVAGCIDGGETMKRAICREAKEEAGLTLDPQQLQFVHMMHSTSESERVDVFFQVDDFEGEPVNLEPHKCEELAWFDIDNLPHPMMPNVSQALDAIAHRQMYGEHGWQLP